MTVERKPFNTFLTAIQAINDALHSSRFIIRGVKEIRGPFVIVFLALWGTSLAAQNESQLGCIQAVAKDKSRGLHGVPIAFQYNPFVITTLGEMKGKLQASIREMQRADPRMVPILEARLRAAETYEGRLPSYQQRNSRMLVQIGHAPVFAKSNRLCSPDRVTILPGEYTVMQDKGGRSLRAVGDICAGESAQFILEIRTIGGVLSLDTISRSGLAQGKPLDEIRAKDVLNARNSNAFEALVLDTLAITRAQCGREADQLEFRVRYDNFALQKILDGQPADEVLLDVFPATDGYRMDVAFTARAAQALRHFQQRRDRFNSYVANRDERAAVGGILVVIGATLLGASSPCWENPSNFSC